jgi:hypothetical protein
LFSQNGHPDSDRALSINSIFFKLAIGSPSSDIIIKWILYKSDIWYYMHKKYNYS